MRWHTDGTMSESDRLTVIGARSGSYFIDEELPDGRLVISPDPHDARAGRPGRPATDEEFQRFLVENDVRPPDDEG